VDLKFKIGERANISPSHSFLKIRSKKKKESYKRQMVQGKTPLSLNPR
jgi:hypothetical protein